MCVLFYTLYIYVYIHAAIITRIQQKQYSVPNTQQLLEVYITRAYKKTTVHVLINHYAAISLGRVHVSL